MLQRLVHGDSLPFSNCQSEAAAVQRSAGLICVRPTWALNLWGESPLWMNQCMNNYTLTTSRRQTSYASQATRSGRRELQATQPAPAVAIVQVLSGTRCASLLPHESPSRFRPTPYDVLVLRELDCQLPGVKQVGTVSITVVFIRSCSIPRPVGSVKWKSGITPSPRSVGPQGALIPVST